MRIAPLNRKLLRDLLAMKGQALAIAMVVAAGVAMYVMYLSTFDSLYRTRDAYYERQRFGDVFASMKRAPQRVAAEIASIPNVSAIETRVVSNVTLDLGRPERTGQRQAGLGAARIGGRSSTISSCGAGAGSSADAATKCWPAKGSCSPTGSSSGIACRRSSTGGAGS